MRWFLIVLAATVLSGFALAEGPPMTRLQVEVRTIHNAPVERASVVVRFVKGRSVKKFGKKIRKQWEMKTNQDGIAKIPPVPQGEILIQVIAKNYQTFGQKFEIEEEERTIQVTLNPPQSQYSAHQ